MTRGDYTAAARESIGGFVIRAGKTVLVVRCDDVFGGDRQVRITLNDVAEFYASQANNLLSGCRTLAGLTSDWRSISELARLCLDWFKNVNAAGTGRAARRVGLIPRF